MCGSGRFLIPILENGIDIEGTDASGHMLDNCRKKCAEKNAMRRAQAQRALQKSGGRSVSSPRVFQQYLSKIQKTRPRCHRKHCCQYSSSPPCRPELRAKRCPKNCCTICLVSSDKRCASESSLRPPGHALNVLGA